ncbi:MAG: hypothetical protein IPN66_15050 [Candidatus Competibacteraceae bacterium]|nr:hypothetical protein [Candidatus Competibacteraceae bacterium]
MIFEEITRPQMQDSHARQRVQPLLLIVQASDGISPLGEMRARAAEVDHAPDAADGDRPRDRFADAQWLALSVLPRPWTLPLLRNGKTLNIRMQGAISVSATVALKELALADAGIAALPEPLARAELDLGRLIRLLPAYRLPLLHFHAVYAGNLAPPAKTRAFIDLAKEQIRDRPWRPNSPPRGRSNPNA